MGCGNRNEKDEREREKRKTREGQQQIVRNSTEQESTSVKVQAKEENCENRNMLEKEEKPIREEGKYTSERGEIWR